VRAALAQIRLRAGDPFGEIKLTAEISKEQSVEWENCAIPIQRICMGNPSPDKFERTFAGYDMRICPSTPKDMVRFCDPQGDVRFEIFNLKIPDWATA
jgi:hypothetical protein